MNAASRSKLLVAVSAIVLSGVVACSNSTSGEPVGGETTSASDKTMTPTTTSTSRGGGSVGGPLTDVDPCDLLPTSTATELGLPAQGEPRKVGETRVCGWKVLGSHGVDVAIFDKRGLKDLVARGTELPMIGRHRAVQQTEGTCAINLGVTESSRVVVQTGDNRGAMDKACEISMRVAQRVEPLLP